MVEELITLVQVACLVGLVWGGMLCILCQDDSPAAFHMFDESHPMRDQREHVGTSSSQAIASNQNDPRVLLYTSKRGANVIAQSAPPAPSVAPLVSGSNANRAEGTPAGTNR